VLWHIGARFGIQQLKLLLPQTLLMPSPLIALTLQTMGLVLFLEVGLLLPTPVFTALLTRLSLLTLIPKSMMQTFG
jgi:hypothetical protein